MAQRRSTLYITVHVSATPPSMDIGAAEINKMHIARGWSGNGYAEVIRRDGTLEIGRGHDKIGAHVKGFNSVSFGICVIGGVDENGRPEYNMTAAQERTLEQRIRYHQKRYRKAGVCGHRDLSPDRDGDGIIEPHEHLKACPCFDAIPWAQSKGLRAANIRGVWADGSTRAPEAPDKRLVYLQTLLKRAGYEFGPVDGQIGKRTREATIRFQRAAGLRINGTFDDPTVARLRAMFEAGKVKPEPAVEMIDPGPETREQYEAPPVNVQNPTVPAAIGAAIMAIVWGVWDYISAFFS